MNIGNPIDYLKDKKNQNLGKEDELVIPVDNYKYYIFVEDEYQGAFYENLFDKIYPGLAIRVFDNYHGKTSLIKCYCEKSKMNKIEKNQIFLIDRDYEYKFPDKKFQKTLSGYSFNQLKVIENFRILKRTNIENYLIDKEVFKKALKIIYVMKKEDLDEEKYNKIYCECFQRAIELSGVYILNQCFEFDLKKAVFKYIDKDTIKVKPIFDEEKNRLMNHINLMKKDYEKEMKDISRLSFDEIYKKMTEDFNGSRDIDGKIFYELFFEILKNKKLLKGSSVKDSKIKICQVNLIGDLEKEELKKTLNLIEK